MDVSKKYLKMCEKAEEIQEVAPRDQCNFLPFTTAAYQLPYVLGLDGSYWVKVPKDLGTFGVVWLPRQDQLQEIIIDKYKDYEEDKYIQLTFEFYAFIGSGRKRCDV